MKTIFTSIILFFFITSFYSQKEKYPPNFGFQFQTLSTSSIMGVKQNQITFDNFKATLSQRMAFSLGCVLRFNISKLTAVESGINVTKRSYVSSMSMINSDVSVQDSFSFAKFEIPISLLISIPLSKSIFINTSMGIIPSLGPANIFHKKKIVDDYTFENKILIKRESLSLCAKVGFEYHTQKKVFFSLGYSVRVPVQPSFIWYSTYCIAPQTKNIGISKFIKSSYTCINLIYFLPLKKQSGQQPNKALIE